MRIEERKGRRRTAAQWRQLLERQVQSGQIVEAFCRVQPIAAAPFIALGLLDPVADRLCRGLGSPGQLSGAAPGAHQINHLPAKLRRVHFTRNPLPEDLALGYKQLQCVEQGWRTIKSGLRLRPVYHWAVHRIHAHVALSVLALLLERVAEHACADTWRNIHDDLKTIKLAQWLSPNGSVWQVTEPTPAAAKRLRSLQIQKPPPILNRA